MVDRRFIESFIISTGDGDLCGLHELQTAIGTRYKDASAAETRAACLEACLTVLEAGHAIMQMTPPHADRPGRDGYTVISLEDARLILADDDSWRSPVESNARYWLVATESGKAEYISADTFSL